MENPGFRLDSVAEEHREVLDFARKAAHFQDGKSLFNIVFDYSCVFLAIFLSHRIDQFWAYLLAVIFIAGRQHALMILVHEGVHGLLFRHKKINDVMSDFFCILPFGSSFLNYRNNHLAHHGHLNTAKDPDWVRKADWSFPLAPMILFQFLLKEAYPRSFNARILRFLRMIQGKDFSRPYHLLILGYYGILFALLTYAGVWRDFLFYWLVPLWFVTPVIFTIRSVAEHFALEGDHELNSSRDLKPGFLNQLFFPHNSSLHLTHHLFPFVQCYHLREVHEELRKRSYYARHAKWNDGYFVGKSPLLGDALSGFRKI